MNPNPQWSSGRSINAALPPVFVEVDCSQWDADIPPEKWSTGRAVNATLPPVFVEVDCSQWDADPTTPWLEIAVAFDGNADGAKVERLTNGLIEELQKAAPDLGLMGDKTRSRVLANGDVVVALTPQTPTPDVDTRLAALIRTVRQTIQAPKSISVCYA